jgi:hypothetical protein
VNARSHQKFFNAALSLCFLVVLWLPLAGLVLPIEPDFRLTEKRLLAEKPLVEPSLDGLLQLPEQFDRYFKDHFGFRACLVYAFNLMRSRFTGLEIADQVLVGKEGWYYTLMNRTIDDFRGIVRIAPWQLRQVKHTLEARQRWFDAMGIRYLITIVPAKWELYPEFMPEAVNRVSTDSTVNQLVRYLKAHSRVEVLDLRSVLYRASRFYPVYDPWDSHWNDVGVFVAVQEIEQKLARWFPGLPIESHMNYKVEEECVQGDLAMLMGLGNLLERHKLTARRIGPQPRIRQTRDPEITCRNMRYERAASQTPPVKALVFHDSFGYPMRQFLPHCFRESLFLWTKYLDFALIEKERPQVVIQEIGQRSLLARILSNPRGVPRPATLPAE